MKGNQTQTEREVTKPMKKQLIWVVVGLMVLAFAAPNAQALTRKKKAQQAQPTMTLEQFNQLKEQVGALTAQNEAQKQEIGDLRIKLDQVSTLTAQSDAQKQAIADLKAKLDDFTAKAEKAKKAAAEPQTSVGGVIFLRNMTDISDNSPGKSTEKNH